MFLSGCALYYSAPKEGKTADITFNVRDIDVVILSDPYKCTNQQAFFASPFTKSSFIKIPADKLFTFMESYYAGRKKDYSGKFYVCRIPVSFYPRANNHYVVYPKTIELLDGYKCYVEIYQQSAIYGNGDIDNTVRPIKATVRKYEITNSFLGKGYCYDELSYHD